MMKQAPRWLPYRVRDRIDQRRILAALRPLDRTPPYAAAEPEQAQAEVFLLLCGRDVKLGVLALKSLLRFAPGKLALTVTSDGTLSQDHLMYVRRHLPGARWMTWPDFHEHEAIEGLLRRRPHLQDLYHSDYAPVCKFVHPLATPRCERLIVVDPDTAFFQKPDLLLDWAGGVVEQPHYLHDHQDETQAVPPEAQEAFGILERQLPRQGQQWRLEHRLFNSGLLAYRAGQLDLDAAERYLAWRRIAPDKYKTGKAAIWFGDWTPEQTCYHVAYALSDPAPRPFGDDYCLGGHGGRTFHHFLRHYLVQQPTLDNLRKLIGEL